MLCIVTLRNTPCLKNILSHRGVTTVICLVTLCYTPCPTKVLQVWENNLSGVEPYLLATAVLQLEEVGSFIIAIIFTEILNVLLPARGGWFLTYVYCVGSPAYWQPATRLLVPLW